MTTVSVIIPSWNGRESLRACLESLKEALPLSSEVIVVDNGSRDGSARMVHEQYPWVRVVRNSVNKGFAAACNQGSEMARGAYTLFLGADTQLVGDAVKRMVEFLEATPRYGAAVPHITDDQGQTQACHMRFPRLITPLLVGTPFERAFPDHFEAKRYEAHDFDYERDGDVEHASTTCFLMRRKALKTTAPLDERFAFSFGDVDLCRRLWRRGWRIAYLSSVQVVHWGGVPLARHEDPAGEWHKARLEYYRKHYGRGAGWFVKACVGWTIVDHCVREFWRRANGAMEEPLLPLWQDFSMFLRC